MAGSCSISPVQRPDMALPTVVDTQIHRPAPVSGWGLSPADQMRLGVELAREAMDSVGVDIALVNDDEAFIDSCVTHHPDRFGGCGLVDPSEPDLVKVIASHSSRPARVAVRVIGRDWATGDLTEAFERGLYEDAFAAAQHHEMPVFLSVPGHLRAVHDLATRYPALNLIVDHLGMNQPPVLDWPSDVDAAVTAVTALARHENVFVKFCGAENLGAELGWERAWEQLRRIVDAFGSNRLMWASDYSRMRWRRHTILTVAPRGEWISSYAQSFAFVHDSSELSDVEKSDILGATASRLFF